MSPTAGMPTAGAADRLLLPRRPPGKRRPCLPRVQAVASPLLSLPSAAPSSVRAIPCVDDGPMLITEDRDDVAVLRIEHGRVGALDVELLNALTEAVTASERALVITGTGTSFSAGVDLRRILDGGRPHIEELLAALSRTFRAV